ncbi:VOC family protein [Nonomuraea sp. SBT364]|uniref:VOC family protein n=1 Tax=Nonomuraea sp. SBT364 TaxID=1580530 RepID=UPI00066D33B3|nr:VOC family protein [Nonomuraea sp. SBT364]
MLTTQFLPGTPCWIDYGSPDLEATAAFYTGLFGWGFQSLGPDMAYGLCQVGDKPVAAIGSLTEEGATPAWILYFATSDCDAAAKAVEQAGGTVRAQPADIEGQGRFAQLTDPSGAEFALWEPGGLRGLGLVTEPGSLGWVELYTSDIEGMRTFYRTVFGWRFEDVPMGDYTYPVASPAEGDQADTSMAGLVQLPGGGRSHWLPYFEVPDCDAAAARCQELGGTLAEPAMDIEGVGRMAYLTDPHGARFAVITSSA